MKRLAIGSIAIVLLASLQCEPQETKAVGLKRLRRTSILVQQLDADAKTIGLSIKSLESQMLVGLRRDIPKLAIRKSAIPYLYLRVTMVRITTVEGREFGFSAFVSLGMVRPVMILEDGAVGEVALIRSAVWHAEALMFATRRDVRQLVKDNIDELLTEFAADYYRQNPQ